MECRHIQDRVEAFVVDDLPEAEKKAVEDHLRTCPDCHRRWVEATEILGALRSLPIKRCPPHLVRDVLKRTQPESSGMDDLRSILHRVLQPAWRPVVGLALTVALVLILRPLPGLRRDVQPPEPPIYAEQEIRKAQEEVKWALAYVHRVMARTQSIVQDEVIPDQVVQPIRDSVHTATESIKEGGGRL